MRANVERKLAALAPGGGAAGAPPTGLVAAAAPAVGGMETHDRTAAVRTNRYILIRVSDETCALPIVSVREILNPSSVTSVPRSPEFVLGVANIRGTIVPIVDLRRRMGLPSAEGMPRPRWVIVRGSAARGEADVGFLVDAVGEVVDLPDTALVPASELGGGVDRRFLIGALRTDAGDLRLLLDVPVLARPVHAESIDREAA